MRLPSSLGIISTPALPGWKTPTQLYVVPRSMPMMVPVRCPSFTSGSSDKEVLTMERRHRSRTPKSPMVAIQWWT